MYLRSIIASPLLLASTPPVFYGSKGALSSNCISKTIKYTVTTSKQNVSSSISGKRRSADYMPSVWDYNFLRSLASDTTMVESYEEEHLNMIAEIKCVVNETTWADPLNKLELIDNILRLGLKRHFLTEINNAMDVLYKDIINHRWSVYACALCFRLLRQHGYNVSEDVFAQFMKNDDSGHFNEELTKDVKGLLSLYEASFLAWECDHILDEANAFTTKHLMEIVNNYDEKSPSWIVRKVEHALDMPLHWRMPKLEARWFIDMYEQQGGDEVNPTLLRLAKLNFNFEQYAYREEVRKLASWWIDLDVGVEKLPYARDRLFEHYFWLLGMVEDPECKYFRGIGTKLVSLISTLDDTYDIYGTMEELTILTNLIERWDLNGIDQVPHYIKLCFLAIYNTTNEVGYWTLKEKKFNIIPYLSKAWGDLCKAYLQEAKWYHEQGNEPTFEEYIENGWVSSSAPLILLVCYFLTAQEISRECLDFLAKYPDIVRHGAIIIRLKNDLGTSLDELSRGDSKKSIQIYMNEMGASEQVARQHVNDLIFQTWKKLNEDYYKLIKYPHVDIHGPFLTAILNLTRTAHVFYQYDRDGHGKPHRETKDHLKMLVIDPLQL